MHYDRARPPVCQIFFGGVARSPEPMGTPNDFVLDTAFGAPGGESPRTARNTLQSLHYTTNDLKNSKIHREIPTVILTRLTHCCQAPSPSARAQSPPSCSDDWRFYRMERVPFLQLEFAAPIDGEQASATVVPGGLVGDRQLPGWDGTQHGDGGLHAVRERQILGAGAIAGVPGVRHWTVRTESFGDIMLLVSS